MKSLVKLSCTQCFKRFSSTKWMLCRKCRPYWLISVECFGCKNSLMRPRKLDDKEHFYSCGKIECKRLLMSHIQLGQKRDPSVGAAISKALSGKPLTEERRKNISDAKIFKPTDELLQHLHDVWALRFVNPRQIMQMFDLCETVYKRYVQQHCNVEQITFMPTDMSIDESKKLFELAQQNIYVYDIAKIMNRGVKQTIAWIRRVGLKPQTKNPNAYKFVGRTSIECALSDYLSRNNILFTEQFPVRNFWFDVHIKNTNFLIETHGDYWHCNPFIYKNGPINKIQRDSIRRDFAKRDIVKSLGYNRIVIWENKIKEHKRNGTLDQYFKRKLERVFDANNVNAI